MADFYKRVPRELKANLQYRLDVRKRASADPEARRAIMSACKQDVLYWMNAFCFVYEPRPRVVNGQELPHQMPFIAWEHQVPAILTIKEHLGFEDIGVEKARGEGMSWIAILLALHDWLFEPMAKISLVSSTEKKADNPEDPDSLFWKIDWELTKLPKWMAGTKGADYERSIDGHTLSNLRNGARIAAYAAVADVGRGGRAKWFLMDELAAWKRGPDKRAMASTQQVTNSRLVVSTPDGSEGAYYDIMHEESNMVKVVLDWKDNPTRNRGLYQLKNGAPIVLDAVNNPLPPEYSPPNEDTLALLSRLRKKGYKLEGKIRSPWYDHECDRAGATPQNIARELDRDYGGSAYRFFGEEFNSKALETKREPLIKGDLNYNTETLEPKFERGQDGPIKLWVELDAKDRPPQHRYVIGCDIATGQGGSYSSNSVAQVIDLDTMEQVLEFSSNTIDPTEFADLAIAMAKWFHNAHLAWEYNGPGVSFTNRVKAQRYTNVYYRFVLDKKGRNKTKTLGWYTSEKTKEAMMGEMKRAVRMGELVLRSHALMQEFGQYIYEGGKLVHVGSSKTEDDSSKGQAHGDRVIAMGVALMAARDNPIAAEAKKAADEEYDPSPFSMAGRLRAHDESLQEDVDVWDSRDNGDLARGARSGNGRFALT